MNPIRDSKEEPRLAPPERTAANVLKIVKMMPSWMRQCSSGLGRIITVAVPISAEPYYL